MDELTPIPRLRTNFGWREVDIDAVDEPLVRVDGISNRIIDQPLYHQWGLAGALPASWVRAGVATRLARVIDDLPSDFTLIVWDAYRPLALQSSLFYQYVMELSAVHPDWPADAIEEAAARYVTPPSRSRVAPPPHLTGAAVDLTLGFADGSERDLGTAFDAFVPEADTRAFEDGAPEIRDLRRLLYWTMHRHGFANYSEEWWHFDYGDQFWGLVNECAAMYGPAELPEVG